MLTVPRQSKAGRAGRTVSKDSTQSRALGWLLTQIDRILSILPAGLPNKHLGGVFRVLTLPRLRRALTQVLKGPPRCSSRYRAYRPDAAVHGAQRCDDVFCDSFLEGGVVGRLIHDGIVNSDLAGRRNCPTILVWRRLRSGPRAASRRRVEVLVGIGAIVLVLDDIEDDSGGELVSNRDVLCLRFRDLFRAQVRKLQLQFVDRVARVVRLGHVEEEVVHDRDL